MEICTFPNLSYNHQPLFNLSIVIAHCPLVLQCYALWFSLNSFQSFYKT